MSTEPPKEDVYKVIKQSSMSYWVKIILLTCINTGLLGYIYHIWYSAPEPYDLFKTTELLKQKIGNIETGIVILVAFCIISLPHELMHAAILKFLYKDWKFKIVLKLPAFHCAFPSRIHKEILLPVLIAPLIGYSLIFWGLSAYFPDYRDYMVALAAINVLGSIGDYYNSYIILKNWKHFEYIVDGKRCFYLVRK
ncbi:hypothetical protein COM21_10215 [Bacillus toyonensis]|uniref:DUF3267 domain-containing protein n=1 Tax=Bacillus toyonensis TaxID=155322 RepID=UPI000BF76632|nr:DUF3267 domain-containing protein [Bacillus toyonensis]PGC68487.1 hypothetical protein COM21_10215 [Bacillus toyonensis]